MTGAERIIGLALALVLAQPLPAAAWNAAGHRLVASLAWDVLDAPARRETVQLLRAHPDYRRWIRRVEGGDEERTAFIEASTWADEIRKDRRFYTPGKEPPTPLLPGFIDMERHDDWHYVNRPLTAQRPSEAVTGVIDRQLAALARAVGTPAAASARAYALVWLIHLVGDAHQPLHASARRRSPGARERGKEWEDERKDGQDRMVTNPFNSRKSTTTLHTFWDDLPGPPWLRGERLAVASRALATAYLQSPPPRSTPAQWLAESWAIAGSSAYPPMTDGRATISQAFYAEALTTAERRVALAGYRLGELLTASLRARQRDD